MPARIVQYILQIDKPLDLAMFYRDTLGMKVLRHEEFHETCQNCFCEGLKENVWSKTIFGYRPESKSFTIEVNYNHSPGSELIENQLIGLTIKSSEIVKRAAFLGYPMKDRKYKKEIKSPGGHSYFVINQPKPTDKNPITKLTLASTDLKRTLDYWHCLLGCKIFSKKHKSVAVGFEDKGIMLKFKLVQKDVTRGRGRIKIAAPIDFIKQIEKEMGLRDQVISAPLQSLKASEDVCINYLLLSDPDAHAICLVDEDAFKIAAVTDPIANIKLNRFIETQKRIDKQKDFSDLSILAATVYGPTVEEPDEPIMKETSKKCIAKKKKRNEETCKQ